MEGFPISIKGAYAGLNGEYVDGRVEITQNAFGSGFLQAVFFHQVGELTAQCRLVLQADQVTSIEKVREMLDGKGFVEQKVK